MHHHESIARSSQYDSKFNDDVPIVLGYPSCLYLRICFNTEYTLEDVVSTLLRFLEPDRNADVNS